MPRRTHVYWITRPLNLAKCHSRRCEEMAVQDRLCSRHHAAWVLDGRQPPMPDYGGAPRTTQSPVEQLLADQKASLDALIDVVAELPTDEEQSLADLEQALRIADDIYEELKAQREKQIAPLEKALARTKVLFAPLKKSYTDVRKLTEQKLELTRSTVRPAAAAAQLSKPRNKQATREFRAALSHGKK